MVLGALAGTYIIIQLWANTMGLIVMFVLDGIIEETLKNRGYDKLPLTISDKIKNFTNGIIKFNIPIYYCVKSINLVSNNLDSIINERLKSGQYVMSVTKVTQKTEAPKEIINDIPKFEPLPVYQEQYRATSNKKVSLYEVKPTTKLEFTGQLERPSLDKITPFAPKKLINAFETEPIEDVMHTNNISTNVNLNEVRKIHSYILDNNKAA